MDGDRSKGDGLPFSTQDDAVAPRDLPKSGAAVDRPKRCTRCRVSLLPKETKCSQCGLSVAEMQRQLPSMPVVEQQQVLTHPVSLKSQRTWAGGERQVILSPSLDLHVEAMAFSANSQRLLAMGRVGEFVLYSVKDPSSKAYRSQLKRLPNSIHAVSHLADDDTCLLGGAHSGFLSPNRSYLALWNLRQAKEVFRYRSHCGDIRQIEVDPATGQIVVTGSSGCVEVFQPGQSQPIRRLRLSGGRFWSGKVTLSKSGRWAGVTGGRYAMLWDIAAGRAVGRFQAVLHPRHWLKPAHRRPMKVAVPSPSGDVFVIGGGDHKRKELEANKGQADVLGWLGGPFGALIGANQQLSIALKINGEAGVWEANSGDLLGYLPNDRLDDFDGIVDAKLLDDDRIILVNDDGHVIFWDLVQENVSIREGEFAYFQKLAVSPNGHHAAILNDNNTIKLLLTPWWKTESDPHSDVS